MGWAVASHLSDHAPPSLQSPTAGVCYRLFVCAKNESWVSLTDLREGT